LAAWNRSLNHEGRTVTFHRRCHSTLSKLVILSVLFAAGLMERADARSATCPIIDRFSTFITISARSAELSPERRLSIFHTGFLDQNRTLYLSDVVGLSPGPRLDALAETEMRTAAKYSAWKATHDHLLAAIPNVIDRFKAAFPDFQCNFPIYLAPTFGEMDGAGRTIAGKPSLILGVDTIASFEGSRQLPVFLSHELFHRYHFQAAGFSDDPGANQKIWRVLWAEGLATYVSARLNPSNPLADALILPHDLEVRATPLVPELARDIGASPDRVDKRTYGTFFEYGDRRAKNLGFPYRSGYYIGYLVARNLAANHTILELAHLHESSLRSEIAAALLKLQTQYAR